MFTLLLLSSLLIIYSYFLYPVVLLLLPARRRLELLAERPDPDALPRLSLVIAAHNEAERIADKLDNALALDYPAERLEVIVASDRSEDGTDEIVGRYADRGVLLVRTEDRLGKENAQHQAIRVASGEILVFSDTGTSIPPEALRLLARAFDDEEIGAVSSEDRFVSVDGRVVGEGAYVRYEMWLRRLESERAGLVGLSGSFFAARKAFCESWDLHSPSDFMTALTVARAGSIAVSAPEIVGIYSDVRDPAAEYQRKVRTVLRGMTAVRRHPESLSPALGLFAFQLVSHKLLRWSVPLGMIGFFAASLAGAASGNKVCVLLMLVQLLGYGAAGAAHVRPALRDAAPVRLVYFFVQVNLAIAHAALLLLSGRRMTTWAPSKRQ